MTEHTADENKLLTADLAIDEIHEAILHMEHNKDPDPDGFPAEF
jgi:hypothetical protein